MRGRGPGGGAPTFNIARAIVLIAGTVAIVVLSILVAMALAIIFGDHGPDFIYHGNQSGYVDAVISPNMRFTTFMPTLRCPAPGVFCNDRGRGLLFWTQDINIGTTH